MHAATVVKHGQKVMKISKWTNIEVKISYTTLIFKIEHIFINYS